MFLFPHPISSFSECLLPTSSRGWAVMASGPSKKTSTKLEKFFDTSQSCVKRAKLFASFLETANEAEISEAYTQNFSLVYSIFLDVLQSYESAAQAKSLSTPIREIFRRSLEGPSKEENKHAVRLMAFRILLGFMDVMRSTCDQPTFQIFENSFNLDPFCCDENAQVASPNFPASGAGGLVCVRANNPPSAEDCLEIVTICWDWVFTHCDDFEWWYGAILAHIVDFLYPNTIRECQNPSPLPAGQRLFPLAALRLGSPLPGWLRFWCEGGSPA
ncbi:hypothetical protein PAPYR_9582 [Paratrimastix pyriformis]|uniref:Uncharacterized protein n=1 Tax=Paratrimastix pyriformis TaxID=342808 RepID=A0ABQ8UDI6_9EUKA|nr:hypothetical protein PAPYR_9582 [Paratrimastix pyriformis]